MVLSARCADEAPRCECINPTGGGTLRRWLAAHRQWLTLLSAGAAFVYGIFLIAKDAAPDFWTTGTGSEFVWLISLAGVLGVFAAALSTLALEWLLRRDRRKEALEEYLETLLLNFYRHRRSDLQYDSLAGHIWKVRRRYKGLVGQEVLQRVVTYKPDGMVPTSGVDWCQGKGVVGLAWSQTVPFTVNLTDLQEAFADGTFVALPAAERLNLTAAEFERTKHYWAVYVAPLLEPKKGRLRGVVTVAVVREGRYSALSSAAKAHSVDMPVNLIRDVIAGKKTAGQL